MGLSINTNVGAFVALQQLTKTTASTRKYAASDHHGRMASISAANWALSLAKP